MKRYLWLVVAAVAGWLLWRKSKAQAAEVLREPDARRDPMAALTEAVVTAKTQANALRDLLGGDDKLAAGILGVPADLMIPPEDVAGQEAADAARAEKAKALQDQIAGVASELSRHNSAYAVNHDGGISAEQHANYVNGLNAQLASLQAQIAAL